MAEPLQMTRDEETEATMELFHLNRFDAQELVAIEHGESLGDCVGVDSRGREFAPHDLHPVPQRPRK